MCFQNHLRIIRHRTPYSGSLLLLVYGVLLVLLVILGSRCTNMVCQHFIIATISAFNAFPLTYMGRCKPRTSGHHARLESILLLPVLQSMARQISWSRVAINAQKHIVVVLLCIMYGVHPFQRYSSPFINRGWSTNATSSSDPYHLRTALRH